MTNNVVQRDRNHDRAMELTTLAKFLTGYEPFDHIGHDIERIAAELETEAAENQPEQNELWKSVLYRSAGWMYLNAANGNSRLNENARLCATKGLDIPGKTVRSELLQLLNIAELRQKVGYTPPTPKPRLNCWQCRIPLWQSRYKPRPLTAQELNSTAPVAHMCSQCEWNHIIESQSQDNTPDNTPDWEQAVEITKRALQILGRSSQNAEWPKRTYERTASKEKPALCITIAHATRQGDQAGPAHMVALAIHRGDLYAFGLTPQGNDSRPEDEN